MLLLFFGGEQAVPLPPVEFQATQRIRDFTRRQPITLFVRAQRVTEWMVTGKSMQKQSFAMHAGEAITVTMRFLGVSSFESVNVAATGVAASSTSSASNAITTLLTASTPGWGEVKFTGVLPDGQTLIEVLAVYVA
jgi:hypothetical protein